MPTNGSKKAAASSHALNVGAQIPTSGENASPTPAAVPLSPLASAYVRTALMNANPISGGTYEDLLWAKTIDKDGAESAQPVGRNPNFHNTTARYAPASAQVGFRVTF